MSLFLLSTCAEELKFTPTIYKLPANSPSGNEKSPLLSNPIPYPDYLYLSMSSFLVSLTAPNKQFSNVG